VRTEGKTRRFVYVATGQQASQHVEGGRRAKVDLPKPTPAMIKAAEAGKPVLEAVMPEPTRRAERACATVKVTWRVAD